MLLVFCLLAYGCQEIEEVTKPDVLLSEGTLEEIVYESTLLKAARGYNTGKMSVTGVNPETHIFQKFNIDSTSLAQNMAYYATKTDAFKEMNARILKRLETQYAIQDSIYKLERKERDSINKLQNVIRDSLKSGLKPVFSQKFATKLLDTFPRKRVKELNFSKDSI